jgi:hypothetical protein
VRGIANTLIGICYYMRSYPFDEGMLETVNNLTSKLTDAFITHSTETGIGLKKK